MRYSLAIAAIAGAAAARPQGYGHRHDHPGNVIHHTNVVVETVVHYVTMTEGVGNAYGAPSKPTRAPEPVSQAPPPVVKTIVYQAPPAPSSHYGAPASSSSKYDSPPIIEQPTPTSQAPAPPAYTPPPAASTPAPSAAPAPSTNGPAYMGCINEWRSKMGKPTLYFNQTLADGADWAAKQMNGVMGHHAFDGSFGQVVAPGGPEDFEKVFIGGWLCEVPTGPLVEACAEQKKLMNWDYQNQVDHNEICTAERYKSVACANYKGMWECDFSLF